MPPHTEQASAHAPRASAPIAAPERVPRLSVAEERRARLLAAALQECAARGPAGVSMNGIMRRAGVTRRAFLTLFPNAKGCLTAALEDCLSRAGGNARAAYEAQERWHERVRAGLSALLGFLEQEPAAARALILQAPACGPRMIERRREVLDALAAVLDEGRTVGGGGARGPGHRAVEGPGHDAAGGRAENGADDAGAGCGAAGRQAEGPPALTAEGLVGAVWTVLHTRLAFEANPRLSELVDPLMSMIVQPYLGSAAARRELTVRPPRSQRRRRAAGM